MEALRCASWHRPITAGGIVKSGLIAFQNFAERAGLTHWHHIAGTPAKWFVLEAKSSSVYLLDYNNDGWPSLYLINHSKNRLNRNNHDRTFTGIDNAGVAVGIWSTGALSGDFDGYGWLDPVVANDSTPNCLYNNQRDGTFDDRRMQGGYALNNTAQREQAHIRIVAGDYENNRHMKLVSTTFFDDYLAAFKINGHAVSLERETERPRE
jgi:enediyne biosynthesis protein E4